MVCVCGHADDLHTPWCEDQYEYNGEWANCTCEQFEEAEDESRVPLERSE